MVVMKTLISISSIYIIYSQALVLPLLGVWPWIKCLRTQKKYSERKTKHLLMLLLCHTGMWQLAIGLLMALSLSGKKFQSPNENFTRMPRSLAPGAKPEMSWGHWTSWLCHSSTQRFCAAFISIDGESSGFIRDWKSTLQFHFNVKMIPGSTSWKGCSVPNTLKRSADMPGRATRLRRGVSCFLLHHMRSGETRLTLLQEWRRLLEQKNGVLVICMWKWGRDCGSFLPWTSPRMDKGAPC